MVLIMQYYTHKYALMLNLVLPRLKTISCHLSAVLVLCVQTSYKVQIEHGIVLCSTCIFTTVLLCSYIFN